jgi:YVTN family beta-propeller protein
MRQILLTAAIVLLFPALLRAESTPLKLLNSETIKTGYGVKSVLIHPTGKSVYSINLEDMSVFEFDRVTRRAVRTLRFVRTPGTGFDYTSKKWINSYEEKPVESHLTHNGRFLWISLHNASGVAVWDLQGTGETYVPGRPFKVAHVLQSVEKNETGTENADVRDYPEKSQEVRLLLIKTGKTPKVIASSPDGQYLFVANWHSDTVSAIRIDSPNPKDWVVVKTLSTGRIPRGLSVSQDSKRLYVANMGGDVMKLYDLPALNKAGEINVGLNPRHLIDNGSHIYVSLNQTARLVSIDTAKGRIDASAQTCKSPRTIALGARRSVAFVVCYNSDRLQAFGLPGLSLLNSWESPGHPVGVDTYEDGSTLEVWVANYTAGTIKVFSYDTSTPSLPAQ